MSFKTVRIFHKILLPKTLITLGVGYTVRNLVDLRGNILRRLVNLVGSIIKEIIHRSTGFNQKIVNFHIHVVIVE
jgi:hypothetical protein